MLTLPPSVRVFVSVEPTDMRKSFDGLCALTRQVIGEEPQSGHLFCFVNRRGDRVKILFWARNGFTIFYRLIQKGVFHFPRGGEGRVEIDAAELAILLEGLEVPARRESKFLKRAVLVR